LIILAEIGVDVSRFPTEKHFASWLGVCPRQHESNQTKKKRSPRKGKNRVAIALRMAAQSLGRTQSPLGLFYRRIKSRIGGKGAVTATAHKLACLVYRMLKYGSEYVQLHFP
jgi:transposase